MLDHPNKKPKTDAEHAKAISKAEMALNRAIGMAAKDGLRIEVETVDRISLSVGPQAPIVSVSVSRPVKAQGEGMTDWPSTADENGEFMGDMRIVPRPYDDEPTNDECGMLDLTAYAFTSSRSHWGRESILLRPMCWLFGHGIYYVETEGFRRAKCVCPRCGAKLTS